MIYVLSRKDTTFQLNKQKKAAEFAFNRIYIQVTF